jgi:hypothetical protein
MRDAHRPPIHVPDQLYLLGGVALIAAAVPLVMWLVELLFRLLR